MLYVVTAVFNNIILTMNRLPKKLLKLRKHYNYSQSKIAEVLGIDVVEYMAIENGNKVCDFEQCKKLAALYRIKVIELFSNSSSVGLHSVKGPSGNDEYYFLPDKTLSEKIKKFIRVHPIRSIGIVVVFVLAIIFGIYKLTYTDFVSPELNGINRLSISDTNVYFIDGTTNVYEAYKTNDEHVSYVAETSVVKVVAGNGFGAVLTSDGNVTILGTLDYSANDSNLKWSRIIDIAAGDNHLVALNDKGKVFAIGENTNGQCDVDDFKNIVKIYATEKGTIVEDEDGKLSYTGILLGSSQLKNYESPIDIASSDNYLVIANADKSVTCISRYGDDLQTNKWRNVVDVACGNNFVAALRSDGTLLISSDDDDIVLNASSWSNIIAISAHGDYLVAYDGSKIYGTGSSDTFSFDQLYSNGTALPTVSNVKISLGSNVSVSFDSVSNASGYDVALANQDGTIINTYRVTSNATINFAIDSLYPEVSYNIIITTLGDGKKYLDSERLTVPFTYQNNDSQESDDYVDLEFDYTTMTREQLEDYLKSVGISHITPIELDYECGENESVIRAVNGVSSGQRYSRSALANATVSYNYCKVGSSDEQEHLDD